MEQNFFKIELTNEITSNTIDASNNIVNIFDLQLTFRRTEFNGITLILDTPLQFAFSAKEFLQSAYESDGTDALVKADIYINYNFNYVFLKSQYIDFSTFQQIDIRRNEPQGSSTPNFLTVSCDLIPYGIEQKVLDRFKDTYSMSATESTEGNTLSVKTKENVLLVAKPFRLQQKAVIPSKRHTIDATIDLTITNIFIPGLNWKEGVNEFEDFNQSYQQNVGSSFTKVEFECIDAIDDITNKVEVDFDIDITLASTNPATTTLTDAVITVEIVDGASVTSTIFNQTYSANALGSEIIVNDSITATYEDMQDYILNQTRSIRIQQEVNSIGSGDEITAVGTTTVNNIQASVRKTDTAENSTIDSDLIYNVIKQGVEVTSDVNDNLISTYYGRTQDGYTSNGAGALRFIANGEQIRDTPIKKPLQISLSNLLNDLDAIDCIGIDFINENVRIEEREFYYKDSVFWSFENVAGIEKRFADETVFRNIDAGYDVYVSEDEFSLNDEMNQKREYKTQNRNIRSFKTDGRASKYKAKVKKLCASSWTREKQRREPVDDKTKDFDNTNFIECIVSSEGDTNYKTETNENFTSISGVFSPNEFPNLRITPLRNLHKHMRFLFNIFWKKDYEYVLSGYEGNVLAETTATDPNIIINGTPVKEDDPLPYNLAERIFNPEIITFEVPLNLDFIFAIQNADNLYKQIEVSDKDDNYLSGWLYKDGIKISFDLKKGFTINITLIAISTSRNVPLCDSVLDADLFYLNSKTSRMRYLYDNELDCWIYQDTQ